METSKQVGEALARVKEIASVNGGNIIRSRQMSRGDRETLVRTQCLQEILKGWYMLARPDGAAGSSTTWYANFWEFLRVYLEHHYKGRYCLSAENSLDLHTGSTQIPRQVIVIVSRGGAMQRPLPHNTSLFVYVDKKSFPEERVEVKGLQTMSLPLALCKVGQTYFQKNSRDAEIALRLVRNASEISEIIAKYGFKKASERLLGAYQFLGETQMVKSLETDLTLLGWKIKGDNPFASQKPTSSFIEITSPYEGRILSMWKDFREKVIPFFPQPLQFTLKPKTYLDSLEELYEKDAYNSLSIEGYQVNQDLIQKVQNNEWNPDHDPEDLREKNRLAARGYFEAFQEVKNTLSKLVGGNTKESIEINLKKWYLKLFSSMVHVGLIEEKDLIGYRKEQVYIRNSRHVPLPKEALIGAMEMLFHCIQEDEHPAVRAVLGHYIFVYIHPYMDGNGRIGRFLMNVMFVSGGYPWTIIEVKNRKAYLDALEIAGTDQNIEPFAAFIAQEMREQQSGA
ncbi:Fic family protein [Candidatus Neptunochlamydia vexilliferae]|uniref:Fido domain-containing protein n=1 Tax=Candidatus Neptunichlamydia vexilliferae TaxID=1651774 RepID=A0ABS0B194_9BACT|nr:Fic family protein [Candidatus Neptunochlamydia vexilliferae]MBF5060167.1 hypothetical protein [Candidatus Neptunochlamydia vexilliferae]